MPSSAPPGELAIARKAPRQQESDFPVLDPSKGPFTTEKGDGEAKIHFAETGVASKPENGGSPLSTFPDMLKLAASTKGDKPALRVEYPIPPLGANGEVKPSKDHQRWKTWTYREYYEDACTVAKGIIKLGHLHHDAVAIFGFNRCVQIYVGSFIDLAQRWLINKESSCSPQTACYVCVLLIMS
jgi:hypothetical protein